MLVDLIVPSCNHIVCEERLRSGFLYDYRDPGFHIRLRVEATEPQGARPCLGGILRSPVRKWNATWAFID